MKSFKSTAMAFAGETEGKVGGRFWDMWAPRADLSQVEVGLRLDGDWYSQHNPVRHQPVRAAVTVGGEGEVRIESEEIPPEVCVLLAQRWARELREEGHWGAWRKGQVLTRYLTKNYVAIDEREAQRLAAIDKTTAIHVTPGLELVHAVTSGSWALWSDGQITTGIGLPRHARGGDLSADAVRLIDSAYGSDSREPRGIGGYRFLATVAKILREEVVAAAPQHGVYAAPSLTRFDLQLLDGSERSIWVDSRGYCEGYSWEAYPSVEAFRAALEASRLAAEKREHDAEQCDF